MKKSYLKKFAAGLSSACMIAASSFTAQAAEKSILYGDANCDGKVNMADAVLVMQAVSNPDKYSLTAQGADNADVAERGDGITNKDALAIQQFKLGLVKELPVSYKEGGETTTTTDNSSDSTTTTTTTTTQETPEVSAVNIHLEGAKISVEGDDSGYTVVSGSRITISHSGEYYLDGILDDGQIEVNIPDETADPETVKLFLNGVNITGKSAPAILVANAENTSINLVDGTENSISDGDTAYLDETGAVSGDAVIEAKDDITIKGGDAEFTGTGSLVITANTQKAISCNNDIKINGGRIEIKTLNSTDKTDAVSAKKSVTVKNGSLTIDAEGDGIKSTKDAVSFVGGIVSIKAGNDAVQASTSIDVSGGVLVAGGDRGFTASSVNITGGFVIATATDNQAKEVTAENQAAILLNCIDDVTNTKDGAWKKANCLVTSTNVTNFSGFTKKYKYVLISEPGMTVGSKITILNTDKNVNIVYGAEGKTSDSFELAESVSTFENVDPSGGSAD